MSKREAGAAVDAMLDTITGALKNRDDDYVYGLRQVHDLGARGAHGRQPADG